MNVEQMRQAIADRYPYSQTWQDKVKKMSDNQVIAVYKRFQSKTYN